jgi:hypothetical protein
MSLSLTIQIPRDSDLIPMRQKRNEEILICDYDHVWSSCIYEIWKDETPDKIFNDMWYKISQLQSDADLALATRDFSKETEDHLDSMRQNIAAGYRILKSIKYTIKSLEHKLEVLFITLEKYIQRREIVNKSEELFLYISEQLTELSKELTTSITLSGEGFEFSSDDFYIEVEAIKIEIYVLKQLGHTRAEELLDQLIELNLLADHFMSSLKEESNE